MLTISFRRCIVFFRNVTNHKLIWRCKLEKYPKAIFASRMNSIVPEFTNRSRLNTSLRINKWVVYYRQRLFEKQVIFFEIPKIELPKILKKSRNPSDWKFCHIPYIPNYSNYESVFLIMNETTFEEIKVVAEGPVGWSGQLNQYPKWVTPAAWLCLQILLGLVIQNAAGIESTFKSELDFLIMIARLYCKRLSSSIPSSMK